MDFDIATNFMTSWKRADEWFGKGERKRIDLVYVWKCDCIGGLSCGICRTKTASEPPPLSPTINGSRRRSLLDDPDPPSDIEERFSTDSDRDQYSRKDIESSARQTHKKQKLSRNLPYRHE